MSCQNSDLAEFLINFEDGKKLWKNIKYFYHAFEKDKQLKRKIVRLIRSGRYKKTSLVDIVQDTSQEIVDLFYQTKNK